MLLAAAGNVTCAVEVRNSGNMRLDNVAVTGDNNDCNIVLLEPDTTARCSMTRALTQDNFDAGMATLAASGVTATPRGPVTALASMPSDIAAVPLNQTAAMDLSANANQSYVAAAGESVRITFVLGNTGSVTLRNLQLVVSPALSGLTCDVNSATLLSTGEGVALAVLSVDGSGSVASCSGLLSFDQDALEAGPQVINVTGSSSAGTATAAASSQLVGIVPLNLPGLLVDVVGANCSLPSAAGGSAACSVVVQNIGNVRLQSGTVTGTSPAVASGCELDILQPNGKTMCVVEQIVSQADLDAADADSAYTISIGVFGAATPMGSNTSVTSSVDAEALMLVSALRHSMRIEGATASPTTVTKAGEQKCTERQCITAVGVGKVPAGGMTAVYNDAITCRRSCFMFTVNVRYRLLACSHAYSGVSCVLLCMLFLPLAP
jgi:hypothetical protein